MLWVDLILAAALRYLLMLTTSHSSESVQIVGASSSYRRVVEAMYLHSQNRSIYDGDIFHQPPLLFAFLSFLNDVGSIHLIHFFFICIDLFIAAMLRNVTMRSRDMGFPFPNSEICIHKQANLHDIVFRMFLFNPLTLLSCASLSTVSLSQVFVIFALYSTYNGHILSLAFSFATSVYLELYNAILLVPILIVLHFKQLDLSSAAKRDAPLNAVPFSLTAKMLMFISLSIGFLASLIALSSHYFGSSRWWSFSYRYLYFVHDLTPNIGIFWYFVTEMFHRFRSFFLICFNSQVFVYVIPLTIRFWHNPLFLFFIFMHLIMMFRPYPVVGDFGIVYCLLLTQYDILKEMRNLMPVYVALIVSFTMSAVMWTMWIDLGCGNANFYYVMGLVCAFSNGFILIEAISAVRQLYASVDEGKKIISER
uniref:GPI transamidase subunit PIG-U n=1 Tax=Spongospora subterranea TaxID=70186 RepID=A0A0H5QJQ3_9EUKA|eukprot:CRZ02233.1 hypothetical protein [Spongospora subterranea]